MEIRSLSLIRNNDYNSNSHINHILVDRYFRYDSSETKFRTIYLKMTMLFCEYYATSPKPPFASNRSKKIPFKTFYCMNRCIFYISIYWILFHSIWLRIGTDINFQIFWITGNAGGKNLWGTQSAHSLHNFPTWLSLPFMLGVCDSFQDPG